MSESSTSEKPSPLTGDYDDARLTEKFEKVICRWWQQNKIARVEYAPKDLIRLITKFLPKNFIEMNVFDSSHAFTEHNHKLLRTKDHEDYVLFASEKGWKDGKHKLCVKMIRVGSECDFGIISNTEVATSNRRGMWNSSVEKAYYYHFNKARDFSRQISCNTRGNLETIFSQQDESVDLQDGCILTIYVDMDSKEMWFYLLLNKEIFFNEHKKVTINYDGTMYPAVGNRGSSGIYEIIDY
ncbi:hypothetical protein RFI_15318 [Reticulomyxa filosa]|uniref:Uncharacterized protein n=1 Tax=Reticulomyxa filosa TaxID=46433 RepID=X6N6K7_RETFI|nr:hypothetical protein RFI_15318 [Reticulomyxa filosa]|eukprot:ETO21885.1 hypothetical protein RFI_15318 [Reticulomyxa filosa]